MTSTGLHIEGLLRALQGDIMSLVVFVIVIGIIWFVARRVLKTAGRNLDGDELKTARRNIRSIAWILVLVAFVLFAWRVVTFASANRLPRSDVDKEDVYDKMNEAAAPAPSSH